MRIIDILMRMVMSGLLPKKRWMGKIKYLKDNVYEEDGQKYILVRDIINIIPDGHPIMDYWEGMLNE